MAMTSASPKLAAIAVRDTPVSFSGSNRTSEAPGDEKHDHVTPNSSDAPIVKLSASIWTWLLGFIIRLLTLAALSTVIAFGASHLILSVTTFKVFGNDVDTDSQLAILGFINTVLSMLITKILKDSAGVVLTIATTGAGARSPVTPADKLKDSRGARFVDLGLSDELSNPWIAVTGLVSRWRLLGWADGVGWTGVVRFLLTLAISVSVVLLGVAINTLGFPKARYYPDSRSGSTLADFSVSLPSHQLAGMDWFTYKGNADAVIGSNNDASWHIADASIASLVLGALAWLPTSYAPAPYGWRAFGNDNDNLPALDTTFRGEKCMGFAVQSSKVQEIFDWAHANGTRDARKAVGWTGNLTMALPSVAVNCSLSQRPEAKQDRPAYSFDVDVASPLVTPSFNLILRPSTQDSNFTETVCSIQFQRILLPLKVWITNNAGVDLSVNDYDANYTAVPELLPASSSDFAIAQVFRVQLAATLNRIDVMVDTMTGAELVAHAATQLQFYRPEYNASLPSAISPVVALLSTSLLALASWNTTLADTVDARVMSSPIRWQVYGSGPRLAWEWVTVVVVAVLLVAVAVGMVHMAVYRIAPGTWLSVDGMMVAASASPPLACVTDGSETMDKAKIRVRHVGDGKIVLTDRAGIGERLDRKVEYRWARDEHTVM